MGRGFLAGAFWGAIVGVALLLVSTQTLDRQQLSFPQPLAGEVRVPGGSEFDQARPEQATVLPEPESRPEAEVVQGVEAPSAEPAPTLDTTALEVPTPEVSSPDALGDAPEEVADAPTAPASSGDDRPADETVALLTPEAPADAPATETDAPAPSQEPVVVDTTEPELGGGDVAPEETEVAALPETSEDTPLGGETENAPAIQSDDTAPNAPAAPEVGSEPSLPGSPEVAVTGEAPRLPQIGEPEAPEVASAPEIAEAPEAPAAPEADSDTGTGSVRVDGGESVLKPVTTLEDRAENVETDRLPTVESSGSLPTVRRLGGAEAETEPEGEAETEEVIAESDEAEASDVAEPSGPALLAYSSEFDNPEGRPLLSIVLVHDGQGALSGAELEGLPSYVAFAVEAGAPDAAATADAYRGAGHEVVMIPSLPEGAAPQDVEQALRVNFETVPEAVAVMDVSGSSFQSDRAAVQQVVDVVTATGHGLITFPRGLNTAHQRAERAGVPTGLIFRKLDAGDETTEQIRRTLDRAAFRARQDEAVILVGTTKMSTLAAIVEWSLGNRAASVTIAPVSAALLNG